MEQNDDCIITEEEKNMSQGIKQYLQNHKEPCGNSKCERLNGFCSIHNCCEICNYFNCLAIEMTEISRGELKGQIHPFRDAISSLSYIHRDFFCPLNKFSVFSYDSIHDEDKESNGTE
jgi:hypothetical protein